MDQTLKYISETLMQHVNTVLSPGLLHGKMGLAIFFFHYAQYMDETAFEEQAMELINNVQEKIHQHYDIDYTNGLAGIGAGIEYLSQNGFLEIDTDEVLSDFDRCIRHEIMYGKHTDKVLCGLGNYLLYRLDYRPVKSDEFCLLTNQEAMLRVVNILENMENPQPDDLPEVLSFLCRLYRLNVCNPKIDRYLDKILKKIPFFADNFPAYGLALLRLSSIRKIYNQKCIETIKMILSANDLSIDMLFCLLQCRRLMVQNGIGLNLMNQLDILKDKIIRKYENRLQFEQESLSLKGYAGIGLAIMTNFGNCDGAWLELLG